MGLAMWTDDVVKWARAAVRRWYRIAVMGIRMMLKNTMERIRRLVMRIRATAEIRCVRRLTTATWIGQELRKAGNKEEVMEMTTRRWDVIFTVRRATVGDAAPSGDVVLMSNGV